MSDPQPATDPQLHAPERLVGPLPQPDAPLQVRHPTEEELPLARATVDAAYGAPLRPADPAQEQRMAAMLPLANRHIVVAPGADGSERIVGGQFRYDTALSLPGGGRVPVGALSGVGVDPAAGHRGALRALMTAHLADCQERGHAASVLLASLAGLYPRFGYGCATATAHWQIDGSAAGLAPDAPSSGIVHLEHGRGRALHQALDRIWRAAGSRRAGTLDRTPQWWDVVMSPSESWQGGGRLLVALHTVAGRPDGYLLYTADIDHGRQGLAESDVEIKELVAVDSAAELDLWRFVAGLPWLRRVDWHYGPVDPAPLQWLADPRQLRRMAHFDFLWLRPLDMPALVAARSFATDGLVSLQVADPMIAECDGRFDLEVSDGTGRWVPGTGSADLAVTIGDLGALWLGGTSARELLAVGRIAGAAEAAGMLDRLLSTGIAPRSVARF